MKPFNKEFVEITRIFEKEEGFNKFQWLTAWKVMCSNQDNKFVVQM